ncbi:MAG: hypothetical protein KUL75_10575 [Sterolibacterium sp.]|nr:hypothetical protein [Sterolibacterium sp.]
MRQALHQTHTLPSRYRVRLLSGLLALMTPLSAMALEIGAPQGTPVIGNSLRLAFPIGLSSGERLPASECFTLMPRPDDVDGDFFLKDMRLGFEKRGATSLLVVRSARGITNPIVGFRVMIGCNVNISRDFTFFSSEREIVAPVRMAAGPALAEAPTRPISSAPVAAVTSTSPDADGTKQMTVTRNTRLNWLARGLYPNSRPTRDEYRRLMKAANPELFGHVRDRVGSVPIPAGTVLRIPANLPKKEFPAKPADTPTTQASAAAPTQAANNAKTDTAPAATTPIRARPAADRLVIGSGQGQVPGETVDQTLERLEQQIADKSESDIALTEMLNSLAANYGDVKTYLQTVDERIKRAEDGQLQAQTEIASLRKNLHGSFNLIELLLAVVGGSVAGAGLIALIQRRRGRGQAHTTPATWPGVPPAPAAASSATASAKPSPTLRSSAAAAVATKITPVVTGSAGRTAPEQSAGSPADDHASSPQPSAETAPTASGRPLPLGESTVASSAAADQPLALDTGMTLPEVSATATDREPLEFQMDEGAATEATEPVLPHNFADPVLELADVMTSLGLHDEAATAVVEHIRQNPDQDPSHWFKVLEIYRNTGNRDAFDTAAQELRQKLNVAVDEWGAASSKPEKTSLEDYPHLAQSLQSLWPRPECEAFLTKLLEDNRDGKRQGFPQPVASEVVLLRAMLRNAMQIDFPPIDNMPAGADRSDESAAESTSTAHLDAAGMAESTEPTESTAPLETAVPTEPARSGADTAKPAESKVQESAANPFELSLVNPFEEGGSRESRPLP